jgi:hypothetical protein
LIKLKALSEEEQARDEMSLRIFDGIHGFQGTAEDNWGYGQDMTTPQWLQEAHNRKSGRCFIFGTGPSLTSQMHLLHHMRTEETWTVNRMKHWKDLPFTPVNHCIAEPGPIMEWGRRINPNYDFPEATNKIAVNWWPVTAEGWLYVPKAPDDIQLRWNGFFGLDDFLPAIPTGWASPLTVAQVAAWMGHTEIFFLGVDTTQTGQAWDPVAGRTAYERNIRSILECFERAGRDMKRAGRIMADCTPGGRVNAEGCLPYVPLEEVLST